MTRANHMFATLSRSLSLLSTRTLTSRPCTASLVPIASLRRGPIHRGFCTTLNDVIVTRNAAKQLLELNKDSDAEIKLRVAVQGGGCSGFQYEITLDDNDVQEDDLVFERDGAKVIVDDVSLDFIKGATVDYVEELIRSGFAVINNPNTESGCGCGTSFALKED